MNLRASALTALAGLLALGGGLAAWRISRAPEPQSAVGLEAAAGSDSVPRAGAELVDARDERPDPAGSLRGSRSPAFSEDLVLGRLVSAKTGQGIDRFLLVFASPDGSITESVETSDSGTFATRTPFPYGTLRVQLVDAVHLPAHNHRTIEFGHAPRAGERRPVLAIDVGPTFELTLHQMRISDVIGADASAWAVRLRPPRPRRPEPQVLTELGNDVFVSPHQGFASPPVASTGVRITDRRVWTRFPPVAPPPQGSPHWRELELMNADGTFRAVGMVRPGMDTFRALGLVRPDEDDRRVELHPESGATAIVHLQSPRSVERSAFRLDRYLWAGATGPRIELRSLPPGKHELELRVEQHLPFETSFDAPVGEVTDVEVRLVPSEGRMRVEGSVLSESGDFHGTVAIVLSAASPELHALVPQRVSQVTWTREGHGWVGAWAFEDVPVTEYAITIASSGLHDWQPREARSVEGVPQTFLLRDGATHDLVLDVVRSTDGAPVLEYSVAVDATGNNRSAAYRRTIRRDPTSGLGPPIAEGAPALASLEFTVESPGFRTATGNLASFGPPTAHGARTVRVSRVELQPE